MVITRTPLIFALFQGTLKFEDKLSNDTDVLQVILVSSKYNNWSKKTQ